jgi:transcriptional regulator with XRE-family HTH domain
MTQDGWQERLTRVIAGEVRRYRRERGMSAQKLADECGRLGLPIARSVIANLEHGRRDAVSVAELLVLAAALRIPPLLLVIPVARQEALEILPGTEAPTWAAALWWRGEADFQDYGDGPRLSAGITTETPVTWVQAHQGLVVKWSAAYRLMGDAARAMQSGAPGDQERFRDMYETERKNLDHFAKELATVRAQMQGLGLIPPALPRELPELAAHVGRIEQERGNHGVR